MRRKAKTFETRRDRGSGGTWKNRSSEVQGFETLPARIQVVPGHFFLQCEEVFCSLRQSSNRHREKELAESASGTVFRFKVNPSLQFLRPSGNADQVIETAKCEGVLDPGLSEKTFVEQRSYFTGLKNRARCHITEL